MYMCQKFTGTRLQLYVQLIYKFGLLKLRLPFSSHLLNKSIIISVHPFLCSAFDHLNSWSMISSFHIHTPLYIVSVKENKCLSCWICYFQRVLTAEFIDGCKISNKDAIKKMGLSLYDVSY